MTRRATGRQYSFGLRLAAKAIFMVASLSLALYAAPAPAKTGVGNFFRRPAINKITRFEPLSRFGDDAVRVTFLPFEHVGWTIELHPGGPSGATGEVAFYEPSGRGDIFVGWLRLGMRRGDYDALLASIDAAMAKRDRAEFQGEKPGELIVCTEAPLYVTERRRHGKTTWIQDTCAAEMPAAEVVDLMVAAFPYPLCWYALSAPYDACKSLKPPS
jgi:hypothetical protein